MQCKYEFSGGTDLSGSCVRAGGRGRRTRQWALQWGSSCILALLATTNLAHAAQSADLSLTMTVSDPTPLVGSQVSFEVTIQNAGPNNVQRALVKDKIPSGYTYVSHTATRGTYDAATGRWSNVAVAAAASQRLTLVATVKQGGNRTNIALVQTSTLPDPDSTPGNSVPTEDDYAQITTTPRTNVAPVITGQLPLVTFEETPLTITLQDLIVTDPDDVYPDDFTLTVQPGSEYTVSGNEITPNAGVDHPISVSVFVNDGTASSPSTPITVDVIPETGGLAIIGQNPVGIRDDHAFAIDPQWLIVHDPDNTNPDDFIFSVLPNTGYTVTAFGEVQPDAGFLGTLDVVVTVSNGIETSPPFDMTVLVTGPNLVVIMVDDLDSRSLNDLLGAGLMPNLQTYFIDRGVSFPTFYTSDPLCCPSRATFFTGQYAHNHLIFNNVLDYGGSLGLERAVGQFNDTNTLPVKLQALGYTTGYFGKYLNGYGADAALTNISPAFDPHYVPPGWTSWNGLIDLSTYCMYNFSINHNGVPTQYLRPGGKSEDTATYQTNVLADLTEDFVLAHKDDAAPFFLNVMTLAPHAERCHDAYGGPPPPGDDNFKVRVRPAPEDKDTVVPAFVPTPAFDEDLADKPDWLEALAPPLTSTDISDIQEQYTARLRAMLSVDRLLGRVAVALGDRLDDTVLVFTSDNGWLYGEHRRGGKIYAYKESSRVPLYVAYPPFAIGVRPNLVINNDLEPTLLDTVSPGYVDPAADGRSLVALLREPEPAGWAERLRFLIEYGRSNSANAFDIWPTYFSVRSLTQSYVETFDDTWYVVSPTLEGLELYDLVADPNEMNSLIHYPQNARDPVLGPLLDQLKTCGGGTCRAIEDTP